MITLTESAVTKLRNLLNKKNFVGIRIGVRTTGCSGLAYVLEYVTENNNSGPEIRITYPEFFILVDPKDSVYIKGSTVDYVKNGLNEGFEFSNPNERDRCGCGESFRI